MKFKTDEALFNFLYEYDEVKDPECWRPLMNKRIHYMTEKDGEAWIKKHPDWDFDMTEHLIQDKTLCLSTPPEGYEGKYKDGVYFLLKGTEILHASCMNYPNCDMFGCGAKD